jgi:tRNA-Thr(GGU) m(6)t(6)A37 methyltransferase TsaA
MDPGLPAADFRLVPVGRALTPWREPAEVPVEGGPGAIEVAPEFAEALEDIERGSHLLVLGFLHLADRGVLTASPRKIDPEAPPRGVFASRSPARPNPISVSVVRLLAREGRRLEVDPLDLADGTPIVDLKSFGLGWDSVFAARRVRALRQHALSDLQLRSFLARDLKNHLGAAWDHPEARFGLDAVVQAIRFFDEDARSERLHLRVNRASTVTDALMGMTGASLGGGRLRLAADGGPLAIDFDCGGRTLRVAAPDLAEPPLLGLASLAARARARRGGDVPEAQARPLHGPVR